MLLLCINDEDWTDSRTGEKAHGPRYLERCVAFDDYIDPIFHELCYKLERYCAHDKSDDGYTADQFIPISDRDEREILEERQKTLTYETTMH